MLKTILMFITPVPKKSRTTLTDSTNTANNANANANEDSDNGNEEFSDFLKKLDQEFTAELKVEVVAAKVIELLEHVFGDNQEHLEATVKLITDDLEAWTPADADDEDDDGEDELFLDVDEQVERPPPVKAPKTVKAVDYKSDIFWYHRLVPNKVVGKETMKSNRKDCRNQLLKALDSCGSQQHQLFMIHRLLTRGTKAGIGLGLGLVTNPIKDEATAKKVIVQIDDFLHSPNVLGRSTNDSLAFQKTVFLAMAPTAPKDDACDEEKEAHRVLLRDIAKLFHLSPTSRKRLGEMANARREIISCTDNAGFLLQTYKRKSVSLVNDENKAIVKNWIQCGTELVTPSPFQRDSRIVRDEDGIKTHSEPVFLYKQGKGHLYAAFKKPVAEGGCRIALDEEGEVVIGRSTFEKLLPVNLRKMTDTHKEICGCKEHKNMQYKHEALLKNRDGRKKTFDELLEFKYKEGKEGHEQLKAAKEDFVKAAYTDEGTHIWPTATEAYLSMTCKPVGDKDWMVPYKCTLGLCDKCPPLPKIPTEDTLHTRNSANRVTYKEICTEYSCEKHGFITGFTANCLACEAKGTPKKNRPKVTHGERELYKSRSIGEFMTDVYPKQLTAYSQHRFLCNILGKRGCLGQREESALDPGCVLCQRDYTTRLPMEFNNATMGVGRTGVPTVGMEGMILKMLFQAEKEPGDEEDPAHEEKLWWFGYLSDEKQQDARTSFFNTFQMLMDITMANFWRKMRINGFMWLATAVPDSTSVEIRCSFTFGWLMLSVSPLMS